MLVSAGVEVIFFREAGTLLCFEFVLKKLQFLGYLWGRRWRRMFLTEDVELKIMSWVFFASAELQVQSEDEH